MATSIRALLEKNKWEVKVLEEIATDIYNGSEITKNQLNTGCDPAVKCGDVNSHFNIFFEKCVSFVDGELVAHKKYFEYGDILIGKIGNRQSAGTAAAYLGDRKCILGDAVYALKHRQNSKYLACALSTTFCRKQLEDMMHKGSVINVYIRNIKQIRIPFPPRHVQDLLGKFLYELIKSTTELSEKLKRENGDFGSTEMRF